MTIQTVAIVGAGTMGQRIAFGCLLGQRRTRIFDVVPGTADKALSRVGEMIRERVADGRLSQRAESALCLLTSAG